MMKTAWICTLLFLSTGQILSAQASYDVVLTGVDHVPPVRTAAFGQLEVWVEEDTLYVRGEFSDLRDTYWAAHVHYGEKGKTGNRLYRLKAELDEDNRGGTFKAEDNQFVLRQPQREALRNGQVYIVISSSRNQQGEIRGQVPRF